VADNKNKKAKLLFREYYNGLDLDIRYQVYDSEQYPKGYSRRSLFIKKSLTRKVRKM